MFLQMRIDLLAVFTVILTTSSALKFLAYNPQIGSSHVNFFSKLSDALMEAGHEVVMLSPRTDTLAGSPKTKARVIEIPQCEYSANFLREMTSGGGTMSTVWKSTDTYSHLTKQYRPMFKSYTHQCNATISDKAMLNRLKEEKFDAAFAENIDNCGYVLFYLIGISKYATTYSMSVMDGNFRVMQTPASTAYVPSMMGGKYGDRMSFMERLYNTLSHHGLSYIFEEHLDYFQNVVGSKLGDVHIRVSSLYHHKTNKPLLDLMAASSMVFLNSDPLADFPKLTSARVIDIGGISVHDGHKKLDKYWSDILNLRDKTIFISFGTWVKGYLMPDDYKETIRRTIKKFPDVTFVWKYEKPEDNISAGLDNVIETTWAPQTDLLHDERLTAFITHGGQGSITESTNAGAVLICIPVSADQFRNGGNVERNGVGMMVDKQSLAFEEPLEEAVRSVGIRNNARTLARMIADRPFAPKDIFVRNMEFLAKYGPLDRLRHHGAELNVIEYYLIDVFAFIAFIIVSFSAVGLYVLRRALVLIINSVTIRKQKIQ